jgi:hypothetical protein
VTEPSENRTLYEQGQRYARRAKRRLGSTWDAKTAVTELANEDGEGVKEVRAAYDFARHVDAIARVAPRARGAIIGGENLHLTPSIVARVAKRSEVGITMAVARPSRGSTRSPRTHPPAPSAPQAQSCRETVAWGRGTLFRAYCSGKKPAWSTARWLS